MTFTTVGTLEVFLPPLKKQPTLIMRKPVTATIMAKRANHCATEGGGQGQPRREPQWKASASDRVVVSLPV